MQRQQHKQTESLATATAAKEAASVRAREGRGERRERGGSSAVCDAVSGTFLLQLARRKGSWQSINKMSPGACKESANKPISTGNKRIRNS